MTHLPIDYAALEEATKTFDPNKPIYMLNLLNYRTTASYLPEHAALAGEPCTGREAWTRYVTAIMRVIPEGTNRHFMGNVVAKAIAPKDENWDVVGINMYPSLDAFVKMLASEEYRERTMPHRLAALEDMRLIVLDKFEI